MMEKLALIKAFLRISVAVEVWQLLSGTVIPAIITFLLGWMVFGWLLFPVEWIPERLNNAPFASKVMYVHIVSEWYAYSENVEGAKYYLSEIDGSDQIACYLASGETQDMGRKARYIKLAYLENGYGCKD